MQSVNDKQEKANSADSFDERQDQHNSELPQDFYQKLLHLPACKTMNYCNGCGRCEH